MPATCACKIAQATGAIFVGISHASEVRILDDLLKAGRGPQNSTRGESRGCNFRFLDRRQAAFRRTFPLLSVGYRELDLISKLKRSGKQRSEAAESAVKEESRDRDANPQEGDKNKNPHAVALGVLGGKTGGPARAKVLSPERRKEIARYAAQCRWTREKAR